MISIDEPPKSHATNHHDSALGKQEMTLADMIFEKPNNAKPERLDDESFVQQIREGYPSDKLLSLIIQAPQDCQSFVVRDNLVWTKNVRGDDVLCLPRDRELILNVLLQAHEVVGHFGSQCTDEYICQWYWWPVSSKEI